METSACAKPACICKLTFASMLQIPASASTLRSSTRGRRARTSVRAKVRTNLFQIGVTGIIISRERKTVGSNVHLQWQGNGEQSHQEKKKKKNHKAGHNFGGRSKTGFSIASYFLRSTTNKQILKWDRQTSVTDRCTQGNPLGPRSPVQTGRRSPAAGGSSGGGKTNQIFTGSE